MLGSLSASAAYRSLTDVTLSNVRTTSAEIQATVERGRIAPTAEARTEFTINRLDRNLTSIEETQQRTRPVGRGVVLDIQA